MINSIQMINFIQVNLSIMRRIRTNKVQTNHQVLNKAIKDGRIMEVPLREAVGAQMKNIMIKINNSILILVDI